VLRVLHTSDWHLGHWLHELSREYEHESFLGWLVAALERESVDALLIAGDVFEAASPPVHAVAMWFRFLAAARRRLPALDVVVIGGNHDSPARLDAPNPMLAAFGIHVVGSVRGAAGEMVVPLHDAAGRVAAQVAAVPFLRPADLPRPQQPADDALVEGVRVLYGQVLDAARARLAPDQALIAMGHCYMVGTEASYASERRILGGNQHPLPVSLFPDDVAYAALGHLHKAQRVGRRDHVRYCGAPIPLAMGEARYRNQVVICDFDCAALAEVRAVEVPRAVELLRVPAVRPAPLREVLPLLRALDPRDPSVPDDRRPYLEVRVALPRPEPGLRRHVEDALADRQPRLVKLEVQYTGDGLSLGDAVPGTSLKDLRPEDVFVKRYRRDHRDPPGDELMAAFAELLDEVHREKRP
jgi:exonuclease SbcD